MTITEMKLKSRVDGLELSVVVLRPEGEPKAVIQFSHGLCQNKDVFMPFMKYMAAHGVACVANDHRGHGGSIRQRRDLGYMYEGGYMALINDMHMVTGWARENFPSSPVFLMGHSMGAMAARLYLKYFDSSIDGLIMSGTPSWDPLSYLGKFLSGFLCSIGLERYRMFFSQRLTSTKYNLKCFAEGYQTWMCSDPKVNQAHMDNPLCNFYMTANCAYNLMEMLAEDFSKDNWLRANLEMPICLLSGEFDALKLSPSRFLHSISHLKDRGYRHIKSLVYPRMRHEVLNEIGKEKVWDDILSIVSK